MKIEIAKKMCPFTRVPGAACVLPRGQWLVRIFPTRFCFIHTVTKQVAVWDKMPKVLSQMMVTQDLEKGVVHVHSVSGSYTICQRAEGIEIRGSAYALLDVPKEALVFAPAERLSFGVHKAQDMEMIRRRCDLVEIIPLWHRLGMWIPDLPFAHIGTFTLLNSLQGLVDDGNKEKIEDLLKSLFLAGFSDMLVPRVHDDQLQGLVPEADPLACSALPLLTEGSRLLRALVFQQQAGIWHILPCLPPSFHSGRFIGEEISLEWSKKLIQKMIVRPKTTGMLRLVLQKSIARFRLRRSLKDPGVVFARDTQLECQAGVPLFLDRFEK